MKRINYSFIAKTPLFTGSDEKSGTVRLLRREKRLLPKPQEVKSSFKDEKDRRQVALNLLYCLYKNISRDLKADNYGFYDTFANKIKSASKTPNKQAFLTTLCESCNIDTITEDYIYIVMNAIDLFDSSELLHTIKEEHQYLLMKLRDAVKNNYIPELYNPSESGYIFKKAFDTIPYINGNSIRGIIRRLLIYDFCKRSGITSIKDELYHTIMTGGVIFSNLEKKDKESIPETIDNKTFLKYISGVEDIGLKRKIIDLCPPIGLLGTAIGSQTIQGSLDVIGARLQCLENGTGDSSYWQLIETKFKTRLDSSKNESQLNIVDSGNKAKSGKGKDIKTQMLMYSEKFITGSVFDSGFILTTDNPLIESCFWHGIQLLKDYGVIGGEQSSDTGLVDINIKIPENANQLYLHHLEVNYDNINKAFQFVDNKLSPATADAA